jgi:hypothetical protein
MKKKTTPTTKSTQPSDEANASLAPASTAALTSALDPTLPVIKIVSEEEEMHVKMELEMEDETHDMLVKWGKEIASDEDYINIAIADGLKHLIASDK